MKTVAKQAKKIKKIVVNTISSKEKIVRAPVQEKRVITGIPVPEDHVRCIILRRCEGMTGWYVAGDIVDLPERRYKTMTFRGLVRKYDGTDDPTRKR